MKKVLLGFLLLVSAVNGQAQVFPSSCTINNDTRDSLITDAQRLALRRVYKFHVPEMDSTRIPADRTDTALNALALVYNAMTMPARDTVFDMLHIHSFAQGGLDSPYKFSMNRLQIWSADNQQWMIDFSNNTIPTSDAAINQLLTDYHLHLYDYLDLTSGMDGLYFLSDSNYNMGAVAKEWEQVYFCLGGDLGESGDAPDIFLDTVTSTYAQLTFKYGWGSCATGCDYNRYWTFRSNFDCTVEYMGSYGDTLLWTTAIGNEPSGALNSEVYPNPFKNEVTVKNAAGAAYRIQALSGRVIDEGLVPEDGRLSPDCVPGFYILSLRTERGVTVVKLLKE